MSRSPAPATASKSSKTRGEGAGSVRPWKVVINGKVVRYRSEMGEPGSPQLPRRSVVQWAGRARVFADGTSDQQSVYGKTQSEVERKLDALKSSHKSGLKPRGGAETLNDHIAEYLPAFKANSKKERTYIGVETLLRLHVQPTLGEHTLDELWRRPQLIDNLYAELHTRRANNTVVHAHVALHKCLKQAVQWRKIPNNPADQVMKPKLTKGDQHPLDHVLAQRLIEASRDEPLGAFWTLAVTHGFRKGELLALRWAQVLDLNGKRPTVSVTATREQGLTDAGDARKGIDPKPYRLGDPKTAKSRRSVRLCAAAAEALHRHRNALVESGVLPLSSSFVFEIGDGMPLDASRATRAWNDLRTRLDLPRATTIHDLRHTCATLLLLQNVNVKIVSEMLGHASVGITLDLYQHVLPTMQEKAVEALDALFTPRAA